MMIKYLVIAIVVLILFLLFFVRTYISSPGFTTAELAEEFYKNKPKCLGLSIALKGGLDAPGKSLCIGILQKPKQD